MIFFKNFALAFSIDIKEVVIYNLAEGIFYSKLVCECDGLTTEIDARTSDAIAIGVRFNCPIYTFEHILSSAGILMDENDVKEDDFSIGDEESTEQDGALNTLSETELEGQLGEAIDSEDYELASKIRDEINKRRAN